MKKEITIANNKVLRDWYETTGDIRNCENDIERQQQYICELEKKILELAIELELAYAFDYTADDSGCEIEDL